ncbi:MAG TPA: ABC transporter permease [Vicinamibacterales bacterium]|nr:ABC transporter permease [Vicinamibacterales bacterium]
MDFRKRFPLRLGRPAVDDEVDAELEFHLAMRRREMRERGLTDAEAERAALERFGDLTRARRECRAIGHQREQRMRLSQYVSELRQDAAFAARQMLAAPGFALVAIATLAIGIGATTAIFGAVHAVVLRPLPVPDPDRLVVVNSTWREGPMGVAPRHYLHFTREQTAFHAVAAKAWAGFALGRQDGAEQVVGARVTGEYFKLFGVEPVLGRVFGAAEDAQGHDAVVVLSHRLWTRQFAADPGVLGRVVTLNQRPYVVIGVMPPSFDFTAQSEELWVPMAFTPAARDNASSHYLTVYARLREEVSLREAAEQIPLVLQRRVAEWPEEPSVTERGMRFTPLMEQFVGDYRQRLFVLFGAVAFVLLIACGNVSNLLLARGTARARELAVRSALGAGQGRLVRQLLTESLVLGLVAAAAGIGLARLLVDLLIAFSPPGVPRLEQARVDGAVLAFAVLVAFGASVVFGLVPAWRASRTDVNSTLKEAGRGAGARGTRDVVRSSLIAAEVALALVLLVGAGLLIRSALAMQRIEPGFDATGLFTGRILLPQAKYGDGASMFRVTQEIEQAVARLPGVRAAAVSNVVPGLRGFSNGLLPEGRAVDLKNITQTDGVMVSTGYFETLGLPIVRGRAFEDTDRAGTPLVVILNETAAARMWPGEDPLGKRLTSANPLGPTTVVGIAADVRLGGPSEPAPPTFYVPLTQMNDEAWSWARALSVVARTETDPAALAPSVRRAVAAIDPAIPLYNTMSMEQRMAQTVQLAQFNTRLMALLGGIGLLLAGVGIYGVIAYFATQRTSEIGIRMALGATRGDVVRLVVRQAAIPVAAGMVLGGVGAVFAARTLAAQLVDVRATDPLTFAAVAAALLLVALAAALIPARRAASLDPTRALAA